jgi:hypothetical protein
MIASACGKKGFGNQLPLHHPEIRRVDPGSLMFFSQNTIPQNSGITAEEGARPDNSPISKMGCSERSNEPMRAARVVQQIWIIIAAFAIALMAGARLVGVAIKPWDLTEVMLAPVALMLMVYAYRRREKVDPRIVAMLEALAQLMCITLLAGLLTYIAAAGGLPLQDAFFKSLDDAMHLDLRGYLAFIDGHPVLARALLICYGSLGLQTVCVPIYLALMGRLDRLNIFVMAYALGLAVTVAGSALLPALGSYEGLGLAAETFPVIDTGHFLLQRADILALRNGTTTAFGPFDISGIVSFPSWHTAAAILFGWAMWRERWLGIAFLALNVAMIVAAPAYGAHYFIDIVGGLVVAASVIVIASIWCRGFTANRGGNRRIDASA